MIHQWSPRAKAPFIVLSAAMMSPERVEEELFGSEADGAIAPGPARTGPWRHPVPRRDRRHAADDPGQDPARADRPELHRVGGQRPVKVDVRVVSATSRNLPEEIAAGASARISIYRLNVVPVHLPPLRERREDIPELVSHFLARYAAERRMPTPRISDDAMAALQAHDWPGNVRQLRNIIERTMILAPGDRVALHRGRPAAARNPRQSGAISAGERGDGDHGQPLREAREIVRARISARSRSGAFPATSRAPRRSSAWSARRCTGS